MGNEEGRIGCSQVCVPFKGSIGAAVRLPPSSSLPLPHSPRPPSCVLKRIDEQTVSFCGLGRTERSAGRTRARRPRPVHPRSALSRPYFQALGPTPFSLTLARSLSAPWSPQDARKVYGMRRDLITKLRQENALPDWLKEEVSDER